VEWQVDETGDRLIREQMIPPMIIVEWIIPPEPVPRIHAASFFAADDAARTGQPLSGFSDQGRDAFMARNYRVASGPENTGLGGSSLGALIRFIYCGGESWTDRPFAPGESLIVGFEPADDPAEPRGARLA